jgi:ParB/RepB/Spo0J family partition protein
MTTDTTAALEDIFISPTNPRKIHDPKKLQELADSIVSRGVLQPALVRPGNGHSDGKKWELIFGTRRYKAAEIAGLKELPIRVVEMDDRQVIEAQVIENGQREDVHPLEEAEGYELLIHPPKGASYKALSIEEVVAKVGKSRSWVYGRLKLLELTAANRKRFYAGKLDASRALLLARIPNAKLQDQAGEEIADTERNTISYRFAQDLVIRNYMLRLVDAPFDIKDAKLVAKAGTCGDCPKRTGNQGDLFADVGNADVCTDPPCFKEKKAAHGEKIIAEAKANKQEVLPAAEAKQQFDKVFGDSYRLKYYDTKYKAADDKTPAEKVVLAKAPDGQVHRLVKIDKPKPHSYKPPAPKKPKPEELAQVRGEARAMDDFVQKFAAKPTLELWRAVVLLYTTRYGYECTPALARRTIGAEKMTGEYSGFSASPSKAAAALVAKMKTPGELQAFAVDLMIGQLLDQDGDIAEIAPLLKLAGVDLKAHMKKALDEVKAAAAAAAPAKKAAVLQGKPTKPEFASKKGARR